MLAELVLRYYYFYTIMCNMIFVYKPIMPIDYERVIEHHIQQYQYEEALKTLSARSQQAMKDPDKVHVVTIIAWATCRMWCISETCNWINTM